jgi:TPR repeat protein
MNAKDDFYIEVFEVSASDTNFGPEEITRDIPNLWDDDLKNLWPDGVIRVNTQVKPGDIMVGKITPLGMRELTQEERLLRAIFGDKVMDVQDTSLRAPPGTYGLVADVKVSAKAWSLANEREQLTEAFSDILLGERIPIDVVNRETGETIIPADRKITKTLLRRLACECDRIEMAPSPISNKISEIIGELKKKFEGVQVQHHEGMEQVVSGEGAKIGVITSAKVYVASLEGDRYYFGKGVSKDFAEAANLFRRAAERGSAEAQNRLGICFLTGHGVARDYSEAVKWFRKAAEHGDAAAQNNLGVVFYRGLSVPEDYAVAVSWYRSAAEQGNAEAQNNLGSCYELGLGVPLDDVEAVAWFRKAAEQGDAEAQYDLGFRYKVGDGGVAKNEREARTWFHRADKRGFKGRPWASVRTIALLSPEQFRPDTLSVLG